MPGTAPGGGWARRLHAGLMPDYNPRATAYWWVVVGLGAVVLIGCLAALRGLALSGWLQIAAALVLAMLAGLFPVRVPGSKNSFVVSEIFIFLLLLLQGPAAATLVAAGEAAIGSYRTSKRWTSRIFSPAAGAVTMGSTGWTVDAVLQALHRLGWTGAAPLLASAMLFAALYFLVSAHLTSGVMRLKRSEPFFQGLAIVSVFRWVGMAYAGSASVAALLFLTYQQSGAGVLMVMVPLLVMLLVTLHFYFRQQESATAMQEAHAEAVEREKLMLAREGETAERHLRELQASERRFQAAFTHASIGMALLQFDGRILQANQALALLLGLPAGALAERQLQDFVVPEDLRELAEQLGLASDREFEGFTRELRCRHSEGHVVWVSVHCSFFTEPGAEAPCLILQAQDISARRAAEAGLQHLAFHDGLTGLPNRRRFQEDLAAAVARSRSPRGHPFALLFLDFDRFKLVNDSLGHGAGDELLVLVARRIHEHVRPGDTVARLGGDEFAIIARDVDHERHALVLAERVMTALRQPFLISGAELTASASIGITFSAFGYETAEDMLRDADTAMYKAKAGGKGRYAVFDASLHTAVSERLRLEGELRHAIQDGQLSVEYQPLFDLRDGRLDGFEALVRWQHPAGGTLAPSAFLPIAEETGQMLQVSDFVMHCACRQLREWQRTDPALAELSMSVNVSADDLAHPSFVARVTRALVESGLRPQHLTLELTENILMSRIEGGLSALNQLRALGVKLAVDDFGTGYSSLSHLSKLPIDCLKIDRSFVQQLLRAPDDDAVVRAIIQLGGSLRKSVVAEGIESQAQMDQLRRMGCELGQGFHLSLPLSVQAASELLRHPRPGGNAALH